MRTRIRLKPLMLIVYLHLSFLPAFGLDTLYPGQSISGNQTITSRNGFFELGFFPDNCEYYCCLGIWYKRLPVRTTVWEVNSDYNVHGPLRLSLSLNGDLVIHGYGDDSLSSQVSVRIHSSRPTSDFNSTQLVLEDRGNLVIRSISDPANILWQSFDHPTGTWLPGAKVGFSKLTRIAQVYSSSSRSWESTLGQLSFDMDPKTMKSIILKEDGKPYGACRLKGFSLSCSLGLGWYYTGEADMLLSDHTRISHVSTETETYFTYSLTDSSVLTRFLVDGKSGLFTQLVWSEDSQAWVPSVLRLSDAYCNQFAIYRRDYHICSPSIEPVSSSTIQSDGEPRQNIPLFQCHGGEKEGFVLLRNAQIDGYPKVTVPESPERCRADCLKDCSCTMYGTINYLCMMWDENLSAIAKLSGSDLYVRLGTTIWTRKAKPKANLGRTGAIVGGISLGVILLVLIWRCRKALNASQAMEGSLTLMRYSDLRSATKNFSSKLGEGGFGTVYKGTLPNSSDVIAVKQLKVNSQGEKQFRAEVSTLGTIHHVNLVCLKGFCAEGTRRYLVYDYMPHGSLDKHLFGGSPVLDWRTRYQIIIGVAKGLVYLHEECRECIIHCDIKPENILLDDGFKAKIADFGLAKLLGRDFSRVLTTMRGTRGYLAPEWISGIAITSKADVYSYGMMLFEIVSGRRNWCIRVNRENDYSPLQVMQELVSDGEVISLLDSRLEGNANVEELIRVCKVAGWCIQDDEKGRPSMVELVQILEGVTEVVTPPMPRFLQYIAQIPEESQSAREEHIGVH